MRWVIPKCLFMSEYLKVEFCIGSPAHTYIRMISTRIVPESITLYTYDQHKNSA